MTFTLKDIDGAVVDKNNNEQLIKLYGDHRAYWFNCGIDAQASVKLKFNREKLADIMLGQYKDRFDLADAIISQSKNIIEVV